MKKIGYMLKKEFLQIFRTREMVALLFIVPLIQLLVMGFAITNEVKHIKLIVLDQDQTILSRELVRSFKHTDRFDYLGQVDNYEQIGDLIDGWKAQMALVISPHFQRDMLRGRSPEVLIIVDGLDGNTAGVALGYGQGIIQRFAEVAGTRSFKFRPVSRIRHGISMEERMWYNPNLMSAQYMIPGLVVVLLTILPMMLSSMSLVREKEIGTLEQLMVTPLKRYQLLAGKLIPFLILAFIELLFVMEAAKFIFSIEVAGSYGLLVALASLYFFTTLGMGILVSTLTDTQQQAMFLSWFFMVFMILMSGFFIPIENMPHWLQMLTYLNPMRYFIAIVRDIFQKGAGFQYLVRDTFLMSSFGAVIFVFSLLKFHKRAG